MNVICVGPVGLSGTAMLAVKHRKELRGRYPSDFIDEAAHFYENTEEAAALLRENGCKTICEVLEGGIFAALWEMADSAGVGLDIRLSRIPIRQHTIEICEYFGYNPYMLRAGGCLLAFSDHGMELAENLQAAGYEAEVIGETTSGRARIVRYGRDEIRYLEPPKRVCKSRERVLTPENHPKSGRNLLINHCDEV